MDADGTDDTPIIAPDPGASLSSYTPSPREAVTQWLGNQLGGGYEGNRFAGKIMSLADWTPLGIPFAAYNAGQTIGRGLQEGANVQGAKDVGLGTLGLAMAATPAASEAAPEAESAAQKFITAYHGSPHDFEKFDISKIGTGEGAQAYGHGLYFAENPSTAQRYRDVLAGYQFSLGGKQIAPGDRENIIQSYLATASPNKSGTFSKENAADLLSRLKQNAETYGSGRLNPALAKTVRSAVGKPWAFSDAGHLYQVRINADPNSFLDWDKAVKDQPLAARQILSEPDYYDFETAYNNAIARAFSKSWAKKGIEGYPSKYAGAPEITSALNAAGIPGIKYLDQGSRGAGHGTRNYVVFDPSIIDITHKNGVPLSYSRGGVINDTFRRFHRKAGGTVPLEKGSSREVISHNIHELTHHGSRPRSHDQIVAIALHNAGYQSRGKHAAGGLASGGFPEASLALRESAREMRDPWHPGGLIQSDVAGRTDRIPHAVAADSFVIPADVVSGLGQNNTLAGSKILNAMFSSGPYGTALPHGGRGAHLATPRAPKASFHAMSLRRADGGNAGVSNVMVAGGEYIVPRHHVEALGRRMRGAGKSKAKTDLAAGHEALRDLVARVRKHQLKFLTSAPAPKK